jgi:hypothetical protein
MKCRLGRTLPDSTPLNGRGRGKKPPRAIRLLEGGRPRPPPGRSTALPARPDGKLPSRSPFSRKQTPVPPPRTRHESDPPGAWRPLECGPAGAGTPLWIEGSAGFGGKRKSAVKPAHSKISGRGARALGLLPPTLGRPGYSPTTPAARGFRDSRVTRRVMRFTFIRWGGASGPAEYPHRRAGDVAPYPFVAYRPQLLPNHTRRARVQGLGAISYALGSQSLGCQSAKNQSALI